MKTERQRWFFLAFGTIINIIIGQTYAWSVFVNPLSAHFSWSVADVSVAFAIFHTISCIPIIIAGKLQDYVQPKYVILTGSIMYGVGMLGVGYVTSLTQLYFFYGVLGGVAMGTIYSGVVPNIVRFFPDRRGLASGILAAGVGSGALLWAPVAALMIKSYSVLPTFKMLGILYLVTLCLLSVLIKTAPADYTPEGWTPSETQQKNLNIVDKTWNQMLIDPLYYCLAAVYVTGGIAGLMVVAHASPILQSVGGFTAIAAGSYVGILAIFNSLGRAGWGLISDKIGRIPSLLIIYSILGGSMLWLATTPVAVVVPVLVAGSCFGGFMGMIAPITADAFGPKNLAVNFGVMFLPFGAAAFIGPRLAAVMKAASGNYSQAFMITSILSLMGIGFVLISKTILNHRRTANNVAITESTLERESVGSI